MKVPEAPRTTTTKAGQCERAEAAQSGPEVDYSVELHDSPLDAIRHILSSTTDRNPADADAIMAMIQKAMRELGDRAAPFADALLDNLDPYMGKRFNGQNIAIFDELGALAADEKASRAARWGALSLLGAVAMAQPVECRLDGQAATTAQHAQVTAYVARQALRSISTSEDIEEDYRTVATTLLAQPPVSSEDIAIELELGGLREMPRKDGEIISVETAKEVAAPLHGADVGEPYRSSLSSLSPSVRSKIDALEWLSLSEDAEGEVRDIYHDGVKVASIVDLTTGHTMLRRLKEELESHAKLGKQFWPQLAAEVIRFTQTGRSRRLHNTKSPTFYLKNIGPSETIMRAYYVPLGNAAHDGVPVLGLIAAFRTKGFQERVLRIIGDGGGSPMSER